MKITWLGQAGMLVDNGKYKVMVDPYLSDSVEKVNPANWRRTAVKRKQERYHKTYKGNFEQLFHFVSPNFSFIYSISHSIACILVSK